MSRGIKFRAWDKQTNNWYDDSNQSLVINLDGSVTNCWNGELMEDYTDRIILMKDTGLIDKKSTAIYEGDIVSTFLGNALVCIGQFNYEYMGDFDNEYTVVPLFGIFLICDGYKFEFDPTESCKVLGNIYEHSHLLEEDTNA